MDYDRIVALDVENTDLQQRAGGCRPDQHGQILGHLDATDRITYRVPDVCIADAVLPGWPTDPHLDNVACRSVRVNKCCLPSRTPASVTSPACRSGTEARE